MSRVIGLIGFPTSTVIVAALSFSLSAHAVQGEVWLKGDLHAHSYLSDGDASPAEILAHARSLGLDFLAFSDHDMHQNGILRQWDDPAQLSTDPVALYGVEWSARRGHALVFAASPFPYERFWAANVADDAAPVEAEARRLGLLWSIAHPMVFGSLYWRYPANIISPLVEIWNGPFASIAYNGKAVREYWDPALLQGRRVTGTGGSDMHSLRNPSPSSQDLGMPTTWVLAGAKERTAILSGLRSGVVSISYMPSGERLILSADVQGSGASTSGMGGTVGGNPSEVIRRTKFRIDIFNPNSVKFVRIVRNGIPVRDLPWPAGTKAVTFADTDYRNLGARAYYRVEAHGEPNLLPTRFRVSGDDMLAISNPIYFGNDWR